MSVHNTELHRCRECNEVVVLVPEGFTIADDVLEKKAEAHRAECRVVLERTAQDG